MTDANGLTVKYEWIYVYLTKCFYCFYMFAYAKKMLSNMMSILGHDYWYTSFRYFTIPFP